MAYDKQKLMRFKIAVFKDADSKILSMQQELKNYETKELETTKNKKLSEIFFRMQKEVKILNSSYENKIAKKELELKNETLILRNNLIKKLYSSCFEQLEKFSSSQEYEQHLFESLKNYSKKIDLTDAKLQIRNTDLKLKNEILNVAQFKSVEVDPENKIGGFKIILIKKNILIDNTIYSLFEAEFAKFYQNCKLALNVSEMR